MPRTTGTYTAPANSVNPAVTGTNIDASDFNALVDDLEAALTESVYTSGLGATDNRLVRTDGTDTKRLQSTGITVDDLNNVSGVASITLAGGGTLRDVLSGNRTYYVRTDGSDSNNGLANTSGGAFLTIQKAIDVASSIDLGGYNVTIQLGAGSYAGYTTKSVVGGNLFVLGDTATPSNVTISSTINHLNRPETHDIRGVTISDSSQGISVSNAPLTYGWCRFTGGGFHILATNNALVFCVGPCTIAAGGFHHIALFRGCTAVVQNITTTLTGTPAFSSFVLCSVTANVDYNGSSFSGSATGARYEVYNNSVINTGTGNANFFPGNSAGSASNGGVYL